MNPWRRALLACAAMPWQAQASADDDGGVRSGRTLAFPRDHGAHLGAAIEWWYVTGWAGDGPRPRWGYQVTFFRSRTGLRSGGRFGAAQLLFAHAALTDVEAGRLHHAERIVRWNGDPQAPLAAAALHDAALHLGRWRLWREETGAGPSPGTRWHARIDGELDLTLVLERTQPLLLQGDAGWSRKGPDPSQASHYVTEPQLQARLLLRPPVGVKEVRRGPSFLENPNGRPHEASGRAWLDHEWSDTLLHPQAVGWDWIGINLTDGGALTAFQLRRADGHALWAGGSHRAPGQATRAFGAPEVQFVARRHWSSPRSGTRYPVQWQVVTPAGVFEVEALVDAQELDSSASTGAIYWEGLAELRDAAGRHTGWGYLELTGYARPLRLG